MTVVAGLKKTGVRELRELLPRRDPAASDCHDCSGTGWLDFGGRLRDVEGNPCPVICSRWTSPSMALGCSVLDAEKAEP